MFEMTYEKTPTHSKEKPSYTARLVWDTLYLEVASIYKGETQTEFGPMPCWVCDPSDTSTSVGFKRKTLHDIKAELEQSLFGEIQKSRGLTAQTMPLESQVEGPTPAAEAAEETLESGSRRKGLFGRGGE